MSNAPANKKNLDDAEIVRRYLAGESELALSRAFGIARGSARHGIRKRLLDAGIQPRNMSQALRNRLAKLTSEERKAISENGVSAIRGKPQSEEVLAKAARGVEERQVNRSPYELDLCNRLAARGIRYEPTKAIGRFNVDIAIPDSRVAVEIFGGSWHTTGRHAARFRRRCDYLLQRGWLPVIVWVGLINHQTYPLTDQAVDYIISVCQVRKGMNREVALFGTGEIIPADQYDPTTGCRV